MKVEVWSEWKKRRNRERKDSERGTLRDRNRDTDIDGGIERDMEGDREKEREREKREGWEMFRRDKETTREQRQLHICAMYNWAELL